MQCSVYMSHIKYNIILSHFIQSPVLYMSYLPLLSTSASSCPSTLSLSLSIIIPSPPPPFPSPLPITPITSPYPAPFFTFSNINLIQYIFTYQQMVLSLHASPCCSHVCYAPCASTEWRPLEHLNSSSI